MYFLVLNDITSNLRAQDSRSLGYSFSQIKSELRSLSAFATPLASLVRLLSTTSSILLYHRSLSNTIEVLETPMHYLQVVQITKLANDLLYRCYVE